MLGWLKDRTGRRRNGQQLYERIVAQARQHRLYEDCRVPDTMDGRLEMLLLHTVLSLERLRDEGVEGQRLGQLLMERLIADVDDALRQIGIGDDGVAMRIKRLAGAIAERAKDYGIALRDVADAGTQPSGDPVAQHAPHNAARTRLEAALLTHVYGATGTETAADHSGHARTLAAYVVRARDFLATLDRESLLRGRIDFPPVADHGAGAHTPETLP